MSLNLNGNVTGIYLGSAKADAVYLGNAKVFEDSPVQYETILGDQYPVVTINGITIMAANLYYSDSNIVTDSVMSETSSSTSRKAYRYNHASASSSYKNGFYYGYRATQYIAGLLSGWHFLTIDELESIYRYINNGSLPSSEQQGDILKKKILSQSQWTTPGDNTYLLDILPDGYGHTGSGYKSYMNWYNSSDKGQYKMFMLGLNWNPSSTGFKYKMLYQIGSTGTAGSEFSNKASVDIQNSSSSQSAYPIRLVKDT